MAVDSCHLVSPGHYQAMNAIYPEGDVVNSCAILEQWLRQAELFERLNGLGLHAIGLARGGFVGTIIENHHGDSKAHQITSAAWSVMADT